MLETDVPQCPFCGYVEENTPAGVSEPPLIEAPLSGESGPVSPLDSQTAELDQYFGKTSQLAEESTTHEVFQPPHQSQQPDWGYSSAGTGGGFGSQGQAYSNGNSYGSPPPGPTRPSSKELTTPIKAGLIIGSVLFPFFAIAVVIIMLNSEHEDYRKFGKILIIALVAGLALTIFCCCSSNAIGFLRYFSDGYYY